jgi:hypothetical protein
MVERHHDELGLRVELTQLEQIETTDLTIGGIGTAALESARLDHVLAAATTTCTSRPSNARIRVGESRRSSPLQMTGRSPYPLGDTTTAGSKNVVSTMDVESTMRSAGTPRPSRMKSCCQEQYAR